MTEADTCRNYIVPALQHAGWDTEPHSIGEQRTITDGRIIPKGLGFVRETPKRVDYLLFYRHAFPLAVVEAKADWKSAGAGLQQAKQYAEMLGLHFAYASNGHEIVEFDYFTGRESRINDYPTPDQLWHRYRVGKGLDDDEIADKLLSPINTAVKKGERYYAQTAINLAVEGILQGKTRQLITMATGTGKTAVAFQICWKLWNARWNAKGEYRRPKILYLADRNILVDQPKDGIFAAFGDARCKIESCKVVRSREMYFALYQALSGDATRPPLYREYPADFFDLIIVDECHRGSARDDSHWREILEWFDSAYQLGMTATPLREDNRDTYKYFRNPIYQYTLAQGIADGFLAPYRVHRIITQWDAQGWRPSKDELDRYGRSIPDELYETKDFERAVALRARTEVIAKHLAYYMRQTDRFGKTIVFCVDQEHADEMRHCLARANDDLVRQYPDYVCRVTSDEGDIGRGHLDRFQDVDRSTPVILTTSQLLTTGVDAPTCKNVVLARVVGSMSEFKQIIGRGTRVRDDYGKLWFSILDYTGSATRLFADPDFDGEPAEVTEEEIDEYLKGRTTAEPPAPGSDPGSDPEPPTPPGETPPGSGRGTIKPPPSGGRKLYVDGGEVRIVSHFVYELDVNGKQLRVVKYTDYAGEKVRSLYPSVKQLREQWADPGTRVTIIKSLTEKGIDFADLAEAAGFPEADPFDLICHLAHNAPLRTRRERAQALRKEKKDFFDQYGPEARAVLDEILEKYAQHGITEFELPNALQIPPISDHGQPAEIIGFFGGTQDLVNAVTELQSLLYSA